MTRRLLGYWCPSQPDGPLIPPSKLTDPCGQDVLVYSAITSYCECGHMHHQHNSVSGVCFACPCAAFNPSEEA